MTHHLRRIGDLAEFINGVAFRPDDWGAQGNKIIRIQNLTDSSKPYNRTLRRVDEKYTVKTGDILVSWSASLGVFVWRDNEDGLVNQHIFRVVPKEHVVSKDYLRHALEHALQKVEEHLHGATMQHVNRAEFLGAKIPLPPLAEQKRIASILDQADALQAKRRQALAKLDTLSQSLFLEMFGDYAGERRTLSSLCKRADDIRCGPFGTQLLRSEFCSSGVPLWGIKHVNSGFSRETDEFLHPDKAKDLNNYSLVAGDIVMTRKGTIGNCAVYPPHQPSGIMHSDLLRLRVDSSVCDSQFLTHYLHYSQDVGVQMRLICDGAIMPGVNVGKMKTLAVNLPSLSMQLLFTRRKKSLVDAELSQLTAQKHLGSLLASLQHKAFRGEL